MKNLRRVTALLLAFLLTFLMAGCGDISASDLGQVLEGAQEILDILQEPDAQGPAGSGIKEDGEYSSKEEVAAYLHEFGHLPSNYITKSQAEDLGWVASKGNLWEVAPGKSIGGDSFGNREGLLPDKKGRKFYECDIDYSGGTRNALRIIFSNDGLIYYTADHYNSFELLYGEE